MRKNIVFLLTVFCLTLNVGALKASDQSQISLLKELELLQHEMNNSGGKVNDKKMLLSTNISYFENRVLKKIKRAEERLENCKSSLEDGDEDDAQYVLKRIESLEKKINDLNEILLAIKMLKNRLLN